MKPIIWQQYYLKHLPFRHRIAFWLIRLSSMFYGHGNDWGVYIHLIDGWYIIDTTILHLKGPDEPVDQGAWEMPEEYKLSLMKELLKRQSK
jgi:hypothetical protein